MDKDKETDRLITCSQFLVPTVVEKQGFGSAEDCIEIAISFLKFWRSDVKNIPRMSNEDQKSNERKDNKYTYNLTRILH